MLSINTTYSFETFAPAILGSKIANATLSSIMDYKTVSRFYNANAHHASIYPHLPSGTPRALEKYTYYVFTTENGSDLILADVWINQATVKAISGNTLRITVFNADADSAAAIRAFLLSRGHSRISIEVE